MATKNPPSLEDLITLKQASVLSGLSESHLRLLVRTKKIWGQKVGHNWLTTANMINEYVGQGIKPGRKPKI